MRSNRSTSVVGRKAAPLVLGALGVACFSVTFPATKAGGGAFRPVGVGGGPPVPRGRGRCRVPRAAPGAAAPPPRAPPALALRRRPSGFWIRLVPAPAPRLRRGWAGGRPPGADPRR